MANTIALDSTALPGAEVAKLIAFLLNEVNAGSNLPSKASLITPPVVFPLGPVFKYCATANPDANPVTLGWGIAILLRDIYFLLGLPVGLRRRAVDLFAERRLREAWYDFFEISFPSRKYMVRPFFPLRVYKPTGIIIKATSVI